MADEIACDSFYNQIVRDSLYSVSSNLELV